MRFIEYMPIGADHWEREKVYFAHEILEQLESRSRRWCRPTDYDPARPGYGFRYPTAAAASASSPRSRGRSA